MFRQLPKRLFNANNQLVFNDPDPKKNAQALLKTHPIELTAYAEAYWAGGPTVSNPANVELGHPDFLSAEPATNRLPIPSGQVLRGVGTPTAARRLRWDHLIYAYMIENTRAVEVFRRVVHEYRHGEKLGTPIDADTQLWLRATEELFFSDPAPFFITKITSHVRPDLRATARNAYQRMFGMDLNHGAENGQPYPYVKAAAANSEFAGTFEEFLREVWVGISNVGNSSGANPTDNSKISELAEKLHDMMQSRRLAGNLAREEFSLVSAMGWFHLTLEFNSPIVKSLRADATGPENRLFKIAERVGLPAHGLSKSFFDIADPMSRLLIQIEMDTYSNIDNVPALYEPKDANGNQNPVESDMRTIITHWTAITGRDVKARKVTTA